MSKYLLRGNYVGDGVAGLLKDGGSKRQSEAAAAIESVGGSLDCLYFAFGETDIFGVCDFPDAASATALSLMVNSSGRVNVNVTPLMTAEEIDAASAKSPSYSPPGI